MIGKKTFLALIIINAVNFFSLTGKDIPAGPNYLTEGYPFMFNFSFNKNIASENSDIVQDRFNNMLFANSKGILAFDSRSWDLLALASPPVCMEKSPGNDIYVGCHNGFGYLTMSPIGIYEYNLLNTLDSTGKISGISSTHGSVFFVSSNRIYRVDAHSKSYKGMWEFPFEFPITGHFVYKENLYFTLYKKGLFKVAGDTFETVTLKNPISNNNIVFTASTEEDNLLIGTSDNRISLFNGRDFYYVPVKDSKYISDCIITDGKYLGNNKLAIGTLLGGVIIIDYKTGGSDNIINYSSGLMDDEVFCLGTDNCNGLWLCHTYGVTRVDPWLNVRDFTWFPGLQGNLTQSAYFNDKLYIGTSVGVYVLEEKKDYTSKIIYEKQYDNLAEENIVAEIPPIEIVRPPVAKLIPLPQTETRSDGFFKRAKNKILGKSEKSASPVPVAEKKYEPLQPVIIKPQKRKSDTLSYTLRKKSIFSLQSITKKYMPVNGIKGKCVDLAVIRGSLIAATNSGLYQVNDNTSTVLVRNENIRFINYSSCCSVLFAGTEKSLYILKFINRTWQVVSELDGLGFTPYSACMIDRNTIWIGSDNSAYRLTVDNEFLVDEVNQVLINSTFSDNINLKVLNDSIYFFLPSGIYKLNDDSISNIRFFKDINSLPSYYLSVDNTAIYRSGDKWNIISNILKIPDEYFNIFTSVQDINVSENGDLWVVANNKQIFRILHNRYPPEMNKFSVHFSSLKGKGDQLFPIIGPELTYNKAGFEINFSAPFYITPEKTEYRYFIKGLNDEWSDWSPDSRIQYPYMPPGTYSLHLQARNLFGATTDETTMMIKIKPPFYKTSVFYGLILISVLLGFTAIIKTRERNLIHAKVVLEEKVMTRTAEIEKQKSELAMQKKEIIDSIQYAKRIQTAVLPSTAMLNSVVSEHFVLFHPRDIVSGDFYWSTVRDEKAVIIAADCTGHGVPGAFMSMLSVAFLNEIVNKSPLTSAAQLLDSLRETLKATLTKSGGQEQRDGLDIALCIVDKKTRVLHFAGAYNPLYLIRDKKLTEVKGDKMPIGLYDRTDNFINNKIKLKKGDIFYIFSDGFIDQFGGEKCKKYLSKPFQQFLLKIHDAPLKVQRELLLSEFEKWKGPMNQIDDLLIVGFKI